MGLLGKLFGDRRVIDQAYDKIVGPESECLTVEDKAKAVKTLLQTYEPFKLAQRLLALVVVVPFMLVWVIIIGLMIWAWATGTSENTYQLDTAKTMAELTNDMLGWPVTLILTFYFAGGAVEGIVNKAKRTT